MATPLSTPSQLRPSPSRAGRRGHLLGPYPRVSVARRAGALSARAGAAPADAVTVRRFPAAPSKAGRLEGVRKIMILGAGPIVIGQACEFDYSSTQACKALAEEGYEVVLINSNPATIMTDPGLAHRTYIGPMTPPLVERIIAAERPDALLPTMGGQTALNLAVSLAESGALDRLGVRLIGASLPAIRAAEDRQLFK